MLHTTPGIVLHSFKYSDTSLIARILTRDIGLQSYLVPGVRKSKSRIKANLFQPLSLVELVVNHQDRSGLQRMKEIRTLHPTGNIATDIRKSSIAMFLSEMMLGAFKHQDPQNQAFEFILNAILRLEILEENLSAFHIIFLLQLSKYLGFAPANDYTENKCYFNMREGIYQHDQDIAGLSMGLEESRCFYQLSQSNMSGPLEVKIPAGLRKNLLLKTVDFYRLHLEGFKEVKSLAVLDTVFQ
jgi:DNA repair protein RecO (recombination protein O)